ncbi:MAG: glucosaminidase domain-containing protein [Colwellia sp.]
MNTFYQKSLTQKLFTLSLCLVLIICIVAPFTFLRPTNLGENNMNNGVDTTTGDNNSNKRQSVKLKPKPPEKPLHQVQLPDFANIKDVKAKKMAFFNFIEPAINKHADKILAKRQRVESYLTAVSLETPLTDEELNDIEILSVEYKVNKALSLLTKLNQLYNKIDIIPTPLILVQAANESAWGTSRFARIGLNYFGIWCYRKGCGMVPNGRTGNERHEVAAFQSVDKAVASYFKNINTHNAYMIFRTIRAELRAQNQPLLPEVLATGLIPYSERGVDYVIDINTMLRQNQAYF